MDMTKSYCDRCGKEIEKHKYGFLKHITIYSKIKLYPSNWQKYTEEDERDICPDCEISYFKWFNHPEEDKNVQL